MIIWWRSWKVEEKQIQRFLRGSWMGKWELVRDRFKNNTHFYTEQNPLNPPTSGFCLYWERLQLAFIPGSNDSSSYGCLCARARLWCDRNRWTGSFFVIWHKAMMHVWGWWYNIIGQYLILNRLKAKIYLKKMTYTCAAAGFSNDFSQTSSVSCFCCIYGFDCNNSTHNGKEVDYHQDSLMTYKNRLWKVESNQKSRMGHDDVKHGKTVAVISRY